MIFDIRSYLLRDVYDDMMLDGVKPERDTFHSLIVGTMKGARIQDSFFFRDEMKGMGLVPDVCCFLLFPTTSVDNLWLINNIWIEIL